MAVLPERTPPFVRLDLRVEKVRSQDGMDPFVVEALNATLARGDGYACPTALVVPGSGAASSAVSRT